MDVFYVGIGVKYRPTDFSKGRNPFWIAYVKKHGKPVVQILFTNLSREDASGHEIYYIKLFGRRNNGDGQLVNMSIGGDTSSAGVKISEETRQKLINSHLGKKIPADVLRRRVLSQTGLKRSPEFRVRMRILHTGRKHTASALQNMSNAKKGKRTKEIINIETGEIYNGVRAALSALGRKMSYSHFRAVLKGHEWRTIPFMPLSDYRSKINYAHLFV